MKETILLADTSIKVVLRILFLTLSNTNMQFVRIKLEWSSYITAEVLPITKKVEVIDKREYTSMVLNKNLETFVIYIITLSATPATKI